MSDNEIRVAIQEARGYEWWRFVDGNGEQFFQLVRPGAEWPSRQKGERCDRPEDFGDEWRFTDDYHNDLNACREMRKTLNRDEQKRYARELAFICNPQPFVDFWDCRNEFDLFRVADATARQHCEAFCKVKGIWKV